MGKRSTGTRTQSANKAALGRALPGGVKDMNSAESIMKKYKNLYNMSPAAQKKYTDSFANAMIDDFNKKASAIDSKYEKAISEAFKTGNRELYEKAERERNSARDKLIKQRDKITDMNMEFVKYKK